MRGLSSDMRIALALVFMALMVGCTTNTAVREGGSGVERSTDLRAYPGKLTGRGRVEAVREVMMTDKSQPTGVGGNRNASADGLSQTMIGMLTPGQKGLEVFVRLDGGEDVTVVQAADVMFRPGDRVRVMQGRDGATRVTY